MKKEPEWMRKLRHDALDIFLSKPIPTWGADLSAIDYHDIYYYIKPAEIAGKTWDDVPSDIKETFDKLGIPEAERKFLAGVGAQYESEAIYHSLKEEWEKQGVIFMDSDSGLREHEEIYREYFGTVVPATDNTFAAMNSACGRAVRLFTSRRACTSTSRCRPTSASTRRAWGSSSAP